MFIFTGNTTLNTPATVWAWYSCAATLLLRSANPFWIRFCQNLVFFQIIIFNFFFFIKIEYPLYWYHSNWMAFVYGKMSTADIFFTYVTKCIYYAFFKDSTIRVFFSNTKYKLKIIWVFRCIIWEKIV
jgi:hypothetical protein